MNNEHATPDVPVGSAHPDRPWARRAERAGPTALARELVWECRACGGAHADPARLDIHGSAHTKDCWFREGCARIALANVYRSPGWRAPASTTTPPAPSPTTIEDILRRDAVNHGVTPEPYEWTSSGGTMRLVSSRGVEVLRATLVLDSMMAQLAHAVEDRARLVELVAMLAATVSRLCESDGAARRTLCATLRASESEPAGFAATEDVARALCDRGGRLLVEARNRHLARGLAMAEDDLATGRVRHFVRRHARQQDDLRLVAVRSGGDIQYVECGDNVYWSVAHPRPLELHWSELDRLADTYDEAPVEPRANNNTNNNTNETA